MLIHTDENGDILYSHPFLVKAPDSDQEFVCEIHLAEEIEKNEETNNTLKETLDHLVKSRACMDLEIAGIVCKPEDLILKELTEEEYIKKLMPQEEPKQY